MVTVLGLRDHRRIIPQITVAVIACANRGTGVGRVHIILQITVGSLILIIHHRKDDFRILFVVGTEHIGKIILHDQTEIFRDIGEVLLSHGQVFPCGRLVAGSHFGIPQIDFTGQHFTGCFRPIVLSIGTASIEVERGLVAEVLQRTIDIRLNLGHRLGSRGARHIQRALVIVTVFHLRSQTQGYSAISPIHHEIIVGTHAIGHAQAIVLGVFIGEVICILHIGDEQVQRSYLLPITTEIRNAGIGLRQVLCA